MPGYDGTWTSRHLSYSLPNSQAWRFHNNVTHAAGSFSSELLGLFARRTKLEKEIPRQQNQRLLLASTFTQEKIAYPLDYNASYPHYRRFAWCALWCPPELPLVPVHWFLCAIPSITTIPWISALGMLYSIEIYLFSHPQHWGNCFVLWCLIRPYASSKCMQM